MHKYRHFHGLPRSMGRERATFLFFFNKNSRNLQGRRRGERGGLRRAGWRWLAGMPRSVRLLRSVRSSPAALRLVRARAAPPFVVRRSSFVRRCSRRVPSGSPGRAGFRPRALFRRPAAARRCAPSSLSSSLLPPLSGLRAPLSPGAPPSSLSSLRALSPRRLPASHRQPPRRRGMRRRRNAPNAGKGMRAAAPNRREPLTAAEPPRTADSRRKPPNSDTGNDTGNDTDNDTDNDTERGTLIK